MYIIYVSTKKPPSERELDRIVGMHRTDQDSVKVIESNSIASGFKIVKVDHEEIPKSSTPEIKEYLGIKNYQFKERVTAKENEARNKAKAKSG